MHAENTEPDVSFPQYMTMIFTSSFDKQEVHCLLIIITVFARVICALFFLFWPLKNLGCVKYADFFVEVLIWVLF